MSILDLATVLAVAIFAGGVASVSGFGVGSLLTPLLALHANLQLAVAAVSIPHLLGTAFRFVLIRKDLNMHVFIKFGVWSAVGGLIGAVLGAITQDRTLIVIFASLLIFAGFSGVLGLAEKMRFPEQFSWIAGLVSGAFGGLVGNQGGIRSAALMGFKLSRNEFVATATAIALLVDGARMPVYLINQSRELFHMESLIFLATIGVLLGTWLGQLVLSKIPEQIFKRVVSGIILVLGIILLNKS